MGRAEALSSASLAFTLPRHRPPSRRAATPPFIFWPQTFPSGYTSRYGSKSWRPIIVLKRCASSAQPSANFDIQKSFLTHFGGWANSDDCYGWENLDAHRVLHDMGSFNILQDYLFFINKKERRDVGLFFVGFMSALAVCRFKSSLPAVIPVCIFLFVSGFCIGYVCGDSVEGVEFRNGKVSGSQGSAESSFDSTRIPFSLLHELGAKLSRLENAGKGKGISDLVTDIGFVRGVQLVIEKSVHDGCVLGLVDGHLDEDYVENTYSFQRPSRKRSKQLPISVGIIHHLKAAFQNNFLGLKSLEDKSILAYGSKQRDSLEAHESCKEKADGHTVTPELDKPIQGSTGKMNPEGYTNGGMTKAAPDGKHNHQMLELCSEGSSSSIIGWKQLISAPQESLDTIEMSQSAHQEAQDTRRALCGNNSSSSLQGSQTSQPEASCACEFLFPETGTLQEYDSKDKQGKVLDGLPKSLNNNRLNTKKLVNQQESIARASENQLQMPHWRNFGQNSNEDPIRFYHEAKATSQPTHDNKPRKFTFGTETEIADFSYELNCGENKFSSNDQLTMDNRGTSSNTLHSVSTIEDEKEFKVCLDEGVLLLSEAKECLVRHHDEEEAARMLARSADLLSRATKLNPTSLLAVGLWGNTLLLHGKLKLKVSRELRSVLSGNDSLSTDNKCREKMILDLSNVCEECERLLVEAGRKYRVALAIDGDDTRALYNWGLSLFFRGQLIADIGPEAAFDADEVYLAAIDKFDAMLASNNGYAAYALFRWGMVLQQRSLLQHVGSKEKMKLVLHAKRLFADALTLDPSCMQAKEELSFCSQH
ncbi:hypothetical protein EJ110_NYTH11116 [Nymphaea thermarum]|nr:hypothetical protein EJ110_NYTH11116 [Nymphaea thermarum]